MERYGQRHAQIARNFGRDDSVQMIPVRTNQPGPDPPRKRHTRMSPAAQQPRLPAKRTHEQRHSRRQVVQRDPRLSDHLLFDCIRIRRIVIRHQDVDVIEKITGIVIA